MIIDQIYVISVKSSVDRRIEFSKKNPDIVNLSNFKWFLVEKDTQNTVRGCYNSHINVLIDAKKNNFKNILILEDDSYLVINFSEDLDRHHFKVFFACTTLRTSPVHRYILPKRSWCNALFRQTSGFVINPTAN